jgi:hypothetical protein
MGITVLYLPGGRWRPACKKEFTDVVGIAKHAYLAIRRWGVSTITPRVVKDPVLGIDRTPWTVICADGESHPLGDRFR